MKLNRFIIEFFLYNDLCVFLTIFIPWLIGTSILINKFMINPLINAYKNIFKDMDRQDRIKLTTITFKTERWFV